MSNIVNKVPINEQLGFTKAHYNNNASEKTKSRLGAFKSSNTCTTKLDARNAMFISNNNFSSLQGFRKYVYQNDCQVSKN